MITVKSKPIRLSWGIITGNQDTWHLPYHELFVMGRQFLWPAHVQPSGSSLCRTCMPAIAIALYNASCGNREAFADLIWIHFPWLLQFWVPREPSLKSCQFVECWQLQDYFWLSSLFSGDYTHLSDPSWPLANTGIAIPIFWNECLLWGFRMSISAWC